MSGCLLWGFVAGNFFERNVSIFGFYVYNDIVFVVMVLVVILNCLYRIGVGVEVLKLLCLMEVLVYLV